MKRRSTEARAPAESPVSASKRAVPRTTVGRNTRSASKRMRDQDEEGTSRKKPSQPRSTSSTTAAVDSPKRRRASSSKQRPPQDAPGQEQQPHECQTHETDTVSITASSEAIIPDKSVVPSASSSPPVSLALKSPVDLSPPLTLQAPRNPLDLPEILVKIGPHLDRRTLRNCVMVNRTWWESFMPSLWRVLRPFYHSVLGSQYEYPHSRLVLRYHHFIRSVEFNGHGNVLWPMVADQFVSSSYRNMKEPPIPDIAWQGTRREDEEQETWGYMDDDVLEESEDEYNLNSNHGSHWKLESLSDFENRIEARRIARESQTYRGLGNRELNNARNLTSKILNDTTTAAEYKKRPYNKLESLIVSEGRNSNDRSTYLNWIKLMTQSEETFRRFELRYTMPGMDMFDNILNTLTTLPNLTEVVLYQNTISTQNLAPFLSNCATRLHRLELYEVRLEDTSLPQSLVNHPEGTPPLAMTKMKHLLLMQLRGMNVEFTLDLVKRCPNLQSLTLASNMINIPAAALVEIFSKDVVNLTQLSLYTNNLSELDMAKIIKSVDRLQKLDVANTTFGLMSANCLTDRHHSTLEHLDLRGCKMVTSMLLQRILAETRTLRRFLADTMLAKDVTNNSVYPTWACLGLRELTVDFRGDPKDSAMTVKLYQQLAQLSCLEYLDISRLGHSDNGTFGSTLKNPHGAFNVYPPSHYNNASNNTNYYPAAHNYSIYNTNNVYNINYNNQTNNPNAATTAPKNMNGTQKDANRSCLTLCLDSGLKELRTLVYLKKFHFRGLTAHEFGLTELKWCAKAWPLLEEIGGKLKRKRARRYNPLFTLPDLPLTSPPKLSETLALASSSKAIASTGSTASTSTASTSTASTSNASTSNASTSNASTSNASTSNASTSNASASTASTSTASTSNSSTFNTSTFNASTFNASTSSASTSSPPDSNIGGTAATYNFEDEEEDDDGEFPVINKIRVDSMEALAKLAAKNREDLLKLRQNSQKQLYRYKEPANYLAIQLRRLNLHHRIRVSHHPEDKVSPEERRMTKYLFGESSDDDTDRRYR